MAFVNPQFRSWSTGILKPVRPLAQYPSLADIVLGGEQTIKNSVMDPIILGAIGAGVSIASQQIAAKKNRAANERLSDKQFEQNKEMWSLQNQYNSPAAASSRLKAAGLSPALAYGGSSSVVGNADSTPNLDYSGAISTPAFADPSSAIAQGLSFAQMQSQIRLNDSASAENTSRAALNFESLKWLPKEKRSQIMVNYAQESELYQKIENQKQELLNLAATGKGIDLNNSTLSLQLDILSASQQEQIEAYSLDNKLKKAQVSEIEARLKKYPAEIEQLRANAAYLINSAHLAEIKMDTEFYEQDNIKAKTMETLNLIDKIKAETGLTEQQIKFYTFSQIYKSPTTLLGAFGASMRSAVGLDTPLD